MAEAFERLDSETKWEGRIVSARVERWRHADGEEVGKSASDWRELEAFYTSPGFSDERVVVYLATELSHAQAKAGENERIEVVPWPLDRLDEAIDACKDAKSLVGLLWLRALRARRA